MSLRHFSAYFIFYFGNIIHFLTPLLSKLKECTVGENIIATIKIRNNYGTIQSFIFQILR